MRLSRIVSVISVLALAACGSQNDGPNISNPDGSTTNSASSLFDPTAGVIPFPFDGLYADATGNLTGTLNIPNAQGAPFVTDANRQDGFSTVASAFTDFTGKVDFATAAPDATTHLPGLMVIDGSTGTVLTPGTDYLLQTSTALDATFGTPINSFRTRILIEPLKPLKESTTYVVAVTSSLKSTDGVPIVANAMFKVVRSATPVTGVSGSQDSTPTNANYAYLQTLSASQKATLEVLRSRIIRPVVAQLGSLAGIPESALVIAWPFTTQSITGTLAAVNTAATPQTLQVQASGLDTTAVGAPAGADIYIGTLTGLPYYLATDADRTSTDTPLTSYWKNNGVPSSGNFGPTKATATPVPCAAFSPLAPPNAGIAQGKVDSTTACFPTPVKHSSEIIPVLATVPNAAGCPSGQPTNGWPVVIFQHGITGNRTQMLGIAPTLAQACMVTIAIDLPLHGLPPPVDPTNPTPIDRVYLATHGIERTFNLDSAGRGPSMAGYTSAASSGTHFINLSSVITSRDNIREAVADLITLTRSVPTAQFVNVAGNGLAGVTIDPTKIYFIGHSLGGIVGGTLLGVNTDLKAATLAMPGGGIAKLLDASASFSPVISQGLAANGVVKGTDTYETFLRFAQTLVDSGDPINYAVTARANHPIHMIEVVGGSTLSTGGKSLPDQVVPNNALAGTLVSIPGYLSGTDPLYRMMGLSVVDNLDVPVTTTALKTGANLGYVVRFTAGDHGSILSPAASAAATVEMQRETVNFLASGGTCLPIGRSCGP
jgi:dienelactone hydrolase